MSISVYITVKDDWNIVETVPALFLLTIYSFYSLLLCYQNINFNNKKTMVIPWIKISNGFQRLWASEQFVQDVDDV